MDALFKMFPFKASLQNKRIMIRYFNFKRFDVLNSNI